MDLLLAINWNASPEIVTIGPITLRWYGLLFAAGFLIGLYIVKGMFKEEMLRNPGWIKHLCMLSLGR